MRHTILTTLLMMLFFITSAFSQIALKEQGEFEPKKNVKEFNGVDLKVGGSFALQFQGLRSDNSFHADSANGVIELTDNFNLATANFTLNVQLAKGLSVYLNTFLSSRHHNETYVEGGYFTIQSLDFVAPGFAEDLMENVTIKIGHMELNYGDAHFRRSTNANAIYNPFVGNLIMDSYTTEVGGELYYIDPESGWLAMVGLTNGKLNQSPTDPGATKMGFLGKLGWDKQIDDDLRVRLTGSVYSIGTAKSLYLYGADRAGSRYYNVMENNGANGRDDFRSGRFNPSFTKNDDGDHQLTAIMINPFVKFQGLEVFGTYETASGQEETYTQIAGEALYRFGQNERFYVGGRYNKVSNDSNDETIDRIQASFGWFLTPNVLAKAEYVVQNYNDYDVSSKFNGGKFDGFMLESVISF